MGGKDTPTPEENAKKGNYRWYFSSGTLWKYLKRIEPRGGRIMKCTFNFERRLEVIVAYAHPAMTKDKEDPSKTAIRFADCKEP